MRTLGFAVVAWAGTVQPAGAHAPEAHMDAAPGLVWNWDPLVLLILGIVACLYVAGSGKLHRRARAGAAWQRRSAALFASGWLVAALALVSPIDTLGSELFSVHMIQHELLMLVAAPLLVLAAPGATFAWSLPARLRRPTTGAMRGAYRVWGVLTVPVVAWLLHALSLWIWHIPALFEAALDSYPVHAAQHLSFLLGAIVFWWSVLNGSDNRIVAVPSLFTTAVHSSLLGALLTFAPTVWYEYPVGSTAPWRLSPLEDQQLGGLIMWVPGGAIYMLAALGLLARWLERSEPKPRRHEGEGAARPRRRRALE